MPLVGAKIEKYNTKQNAFRVFFFFWLLKNIKIIGLDGLMPPFVARMMLKNLLSETGAVDVSIYLRCSDVLMSEHCLYGSEVCSPFKEVCGEGVAESVGADCLFQANQFCEFFDYMEDHDAGDVFPEAADEDEVFVAWLYKSLDTLGEVVHELFYGTLGYGNKPLFAAFPFDFNETLIKIEVRKLEVAEFGDTKSAAVERFKYGAISLSFTSGAVDSADEAVDFLNG